MWTQFHNDGNVPTQYAASTPRWRIATVTKEIRPEADVNAMGLYSKQSNSKVCLGVLPTATDFVSTKSLTKDV